MLTLAILFAEIDIEKNIKGCVNAFTLETTEINFKVLLSRKVDDGHIHLTLWSVP